MTDQKKETKASVAELKEEDLDKARGGAPIGGQGGIKLNRETQSPLRSGKGADNIIGGEGADLFN